VSEGSAVRSNHAERQKGCQAVHARDGVGSRDTPSLSTVNGGGGEGPPKLCKTEAWGQPAVRFLPYCAGGEGHARRASGGVAAPHLAAALGQPTGRVGGGRRRRDGACNLVHDVPRIHCARGGGGGGGGGAGRKEVYAMACMPRAALVSVGWREAGHRCVRATLHTPLPLLRSTHPGGCRWPSRCR
jgi:hypothetical protein